MIRELQRTTLTDCLTFDKTICPFKLLIFDPHGYLLISTLFRQSTLFELGYTLFLDLYSKRQSIPSVPAVYLVSPSQSSIDKIASDITSNLYDSVFIIFTSSVDRSLLQSLASSIPPPLLSRIQGIRDTHLNFLSLHSSLFSLQMTNSFAQFGGKLSDSQVQSILSSLSTSLFHVCQTLNVVPIIRAPQGSIASEVASSLDNQIRLNFSKTATSASVVRPLMILVDRKSDVATPLSHSWNYHSLLNELIDSGKIELKDLTKIEYKTAQNQSKMIVLDDSDPIFDKNCAKVLPDVTEEVQKTLEDYQNQAKTQDDQVDDSENFAKLSKVVGSLGELTRVKTSIDAHTTLGHLILNELQIRSLDQFIDVEKELLNLNFGPASKSLRERVRHLIMTPSTSDSKVGLLDRLRLYIIYSISQSISIEEARELESSLGDTQSTVGSFCSRHFSWIANDQSPTSAGSTSSLPSHHPLSLSLNLAGKGLKMITSAVSNLPGFDRSKPLPIVQLVNSLISINTPIPPSIAQFDPKLPPGSHGRPRVYDSVVIVVLGGISVIEYYSLLEYCNYKKINATIGSTEVLTPIGFLNQLIELSKQ
ncbi:hypothetical protein RCL1_000989 [Eukaryota sp. TZLM3-RCL]